MISLNAASYNKVGGADPALEELIKVIMIRIARCHSKVASKPY